MWKKEWNINIRSVCYDFSDQVPEEEIKSWIEEMREDYNGEIVQGMPKDGNEAFFMTDRIIRCREAAKCGIPFLFYLHEANKGESYEEIPYAVTSLDGVTISYIEKIYRRFRDIPWTILETERCILREITEDDLEELYEVYADPSVSLYTEGLYEDRDLERAYIKDYIQKVYRFCGYGIWAVIQKGSGRMIGRAGLACRDGFDTPELGYVIAVPYQRQGYAAEVCRAVLNYAVSELGFQQIRVVFTKENEASFQLCKKLGFQKECEIEIEGNTMQQYIYCETLKGENKVENHER